MPWGNKNSKRIAPCHKNEREIQHSIIKTYQLNARKRLMALHHKSCRYIELWGGGGQYFVSFAAGKNKRKAHDFVGDLAFDGPMATLIRAGWFLVKFKSCPGGKTLSDREKECEKREIK